MEDWITPIVTGLCAFASYYVGYWFRGYQDRKYRENRPRSFEWED